jgi:hypothetical protein
MRIVNMANEITSLKVCVSNLIDNATNGTQSKMCSTNMKTSRDCNVATKTPAPTTSNKIPSVRVTSNHAASCHETQQHNIQDADIKFDSNPCSTILKTRSPNHGSELPPQASIPNCENVIISPDNFYGKEESVFKTVSYKRRQNRNNIIGSAKNAADCPLKGVPKKIHLHVWRLQKGTTKEQLAAYLKDIIPTETDIEQLSPRGDYASF